MASMLFALVMIALARNCFATSADSSHEPLFEPLNRGYSRVLENEINETLVCLRFTLETGLPEFNIPSLETILVDELNINLKDFNFDSATGYVNTSNIVINGITGFYASYLSDELVTNPLGLELNATINIPSLNVFLDYDMDLVANNIAVYGLGTLSVAMTDLKFDIRITLTLAPATEVTDLAIYINIGTSDAKFTGWFHDEEHSEMISDLANQLIPAWINQQPEDISELLSPILKDFINSSLAGNGAFTAKAVDINELLTAMMEHCVEAGILP